MAKRSTSVGSRGLLSRGARLVVATPYVWLIALFLLPFLIVVKISLSETAIAQPPYLPVLDVAAGWQGLRDFVAGLSFANYVTLAGDDL
jgi:putrescine transport system permease protein